VNDAENVPSVLVSTGAGTSPPLSELNVMVSRPNALPLPKVSFPVAVAVVQNGVSNRI
jgi:hypothetical protein